MPQNLVRRDAFVTPQVDHGDQFHAARLAMGLLHDDLQTPVRARQLERFAVCRGRPELRGRHCPEAARLAARQAPRVDHERRVLRRVDGDRRPRLAVVTGEQDDERRLESRMAHTYVENQRPLAHFRSADLDAGCLADVEARNLRIAAGDLDARHRFGQFHGLDEL